MHRIIMILLWKIQYSQFNYLELIVKGDEAIHPLDGRFKVLCHELGELSRALEQLVEVEGDHHRMTTGLASAHCIIIK